MDNTISLQSKKPKVVLFLPRLQADIPQGGGEQRLPLQLLAISSLLADSFDIVIVDGSIEDKYEELVIQKCDGAVCLGISCMIGYQIYNGADVARKVRKKFPGLPIVFGGWFPTVRPHMFLEEGVADVVVRGQGERTFLEIVGAFLHGNSLDNVLGITYKKNGKIIDNPDRPLTDMNDLPTLPYQLVDLERYIKSSSCEAITSSLRRRNSISERLGRAKIDPNIELRVLHYFSSWGCPESCKFCCSPEVTKRRLTALDPVRIVDEVEGLIKKYNYNFLIFCDANFGVSEKRVKRFSEELIRRNLKINWIAFAEARSIARCSPETLDLMVQSNCFSLLIGGESGCKETLSHINKRITPEDIESSVDLLMSKGILPSISYIIGFPGETSNWIDETLQQMCRLHLKHSELLLKTYIYFPLPGSAFYHSALEAGYTGPETIDDWGNLNIASMTDSKIPHNIEKNLLRKFVLLRDSYFYWGFNARWEKPKLYLIQRLLQRSAVFRVRHRLFGFPLEFWLYYGLRKVYRRVH